MKRAKEREEERERERMTKWDASRKGEAGEHAKNLLAIRAST